MIIVRLNYTKIIIVFRSDATDVIYPAIVILDSGWQQKRPIACNVWDFSTRRYYYFNILLL